MSNNSNTCVTLSSTSIDCLFPRELRFSWLSLCQVIFSYILHIVNIRRFWVLLKFYGTPCCSKQSIWLNLNLKLWSAFYCCCGSNVSSIFKVFVMLFGSVLCLLHWPIWDLGSVRSCTSVIFKIYHLLSRVGYSHVWLSCDPWSSYASLWSPFPKLLPLLDHFSSLWFTEAPLLDPIFWKWGLFL